MGHLVTCLQLLDHLRQVLLPVFEDHLSEPVSLVHLRPPLLLLSMSLRRGLRKGQAAGNSQKVRRAAMRSSHRSVGMCCRVEQKGQKRQGQDDKTPFAPVPLKRQKKKMPHNSDRL